MRPRLVRSVGVLVLLLATACANPFGSKPLDMTQLEGTLKDQVESRLEVDGVTVECPDDVQAKAGDTFRCTARGPDGSIPALEVTQTDDVGNLTWEFVEAETG